MDCYSSFHNHKRQANENNKRVRTHFPRWIIRQSNFQTQSLVSSITILTRGFRRKHSTGYLQNSSKVLHYFSYINNEIIWLNMGFTIDTFSHVLFYIRNLLLQKSITCIIVFIDVYQGTAWSRFSLTIPFHAVFWEWFDRYICTSPVSEFASKWTVP